ncbi:MAG: hypothetical protein IJB00_04775 [Akkermansia sp.]|nr:hypothetical protein [Akkermansia sp.]
MTLSHKEVTCQVCGHPYTFDIGTYGFKRMTCENCASRIYVRTGKKVKNIAIFHTETPIKEHIQDWTFEDFGKTFLTKNNIKTKELTTFFTKLLSIPEWNDIATLCHISAESVTAIINAPNPIGQYHLDPFYGIIKREIHRADNWGCEHWESYVQQRTGTYKVLCKRSKKSNHLPAYTGKLDEQGHAMGDKCDVEVEGFNFIITGKAHQTLSQTAVEELIIQAGGYISKTVREADYLVVGFNNQFKVTSKTREAEKWGVQKITPDSLFAALNSQESYGANVIS